MGLGGANWVIKWMATAIVIIFQVEVEGDEGTGWSEEFNRGFK